MAHPKSATLFLVSLTCIISYFPGLFGGFLFDDYHNIVENAAIQLADSDLNSWLAAALSSNAGILRRPISMLSFAMNDYYFGMSPVAFKIVNLIIHLFIGLLIYILAHQLVPRLIQPTYSISEERRFSAISIFISSIWLLHPLNLSSVLYVVQRMNQLSTLFILVGVLAYTTGRVRSLNGRPGMLVAMATSALCGILAVLSKENGAILFLYIFVVEWVCFRFKTNNKYEQVAITSYFSLFLILPIIFVIGSLLFTPDLLLGSYKIRDFTLEERLMTQARILGHYLLWILVPLPSFMGMYHDYINISSDLFTPPSTFLAIISIAILTISALKLRLQHPVFTFAVLWFLAGHSMESSIIGLEPVFEHRNYAPMIGIIFLVSIAGAHAIARMKQSAILAIACTVIFALAFATHIRASTWSDPVQLALTSVKNHPDSARSQYDAGLMTFMEALNNGDRDVASKKSKAYFVEAMELSESYIHPVVSLMLTQHRDNQVPKELMDELLKRITLSKFIQPNPILQLQEAITDGRVIASEADMRAIFEASMDNPSMNTAARAQMLNNYGRYFFVVKKDEQSAVSLTLAAAAQSPTNPVYQINLAKLALALDDHERAKHHISIATMLDSAQINRDAIESVTARIAQQN